MNADGGDLHPNWCALTTIGYPLKRFLRAGSIVQAQPLKDNVCKISGISGSEAKEFYVETTSTKTAKTCSAPPVKIKTLTARKLASFDKQKYFRFATANNVQELKSMELRENQKDCRDAYGWTALMMAACEGAVAATRWLCSQNVDEALKNKAGQTALDLAVRKNHPEVIAVLQRELCEATRPAENLNSPIEPHYCTVCRETFRETTRRSHMTSTVHQFNEQAQLPPKRLDKFNIPARNRGLQLMLKQGWDKEHGLGPTQSGRLYPIKTVLRKQRTGIGIEQSPAQVTHYKPYDPRAIQRRAPPVQRKRTRNEMDQERRHDWRRTRNIRRALNAD